MRPCVLLLVVLFCLLSLCDARNRHVRRDAGTQLTHLTNEGEDHTPVVAPAGSVYASMVAAVTGEEVALFTSQKDKTVSNATHAFIIMHGKIRNGGQYWTVMNEAVKSAAKAGVSNVDQNVLIISPQFFSARYNTGQYTGRQLAWDDVNGWEAGDPAIHPVGTTVTSIDVLDSIVASLVNASGYPSMRNITIVGHGGGGQLIQRYATVGKDFSTQTAVHIRYIHADPSSSAYFTSDRPASDGEALPEKSTCPLYNTWRYGFDNFTGSSSERAFTPQQYFARYISRDVVSMIGYQDVKASGDDNCPAVMQGGLKRRDRNLIWWRYINSLARTSEDLSGFPGIFNSLPDWSGTIQSSDFQPKLIIVANATHDAKEVLGSAEGFSALFAASHQIVKGYRPSSKDGSSPSATQASGGATSSLSSDSQAATTTSLQFSSASRTGNPLQVMQLVCTVLLISFCM